MQILQKFARYEIGYDDLPEEYRDDYNGEFDDEDYEVVYQITVDDLIAVVDYLNERRTGEDRITVEQFFNEWVLGLCDIKVRESLGVDEAMWNKDENGEIYFNPIPTTRFDLFRAIFGRLAEANFLEMPQGVSAYDAVDGDTIFDIKDCFDRNRRLPVSDWEYPDDIKREFIIEMDDMIHKGKDYSIDHGALFMRCVNELVEKGDETALSILGYQYYGGTGAFPCDWQKSRDIIEGLFEKTGEPSYANTLGYIYYYGRCNDGVPEYDKAYRMFAFGNAAGVFESTYKLADMIRQGLSVPANPKVAHNMIRDIYSETRRFLEAGCNWGKFADVALRMGAYYEERARNVCNDDYDDYLTEYDAERKKIDLLTAYKYYLQASLAIRLRMEEEDYYGDDVVVKNIREARSRVMHEIDFIEEDTIRQNQPLMLFDTGREYQQLTVCFNRSGDDIRLTISRGNGEMILETYPEYDFCRLTETFDVYAVDADADIPIEYGRDCVVTDMESIWGTNAVIFYCGTEPVATINCREWVRRLERDDIPFDGSDSEDDFDESDDELYMIATVSFDGSTKCYDYICDLPDVAAGERVVVETGDGEKEVTVRLVSYVHKSALAMPLKKYRRVVRKV